VSTGISLHIGLNAVDPRHYGGWAGILRGCENDAAAMAEVARGSSFKALTLLTRQATSENVLRLLYAASSRLIAGDIFLLTFAGHGSQIPDVNGDEEDGLDETWLLFDRMLIDDELYGAFSRFVAGVRIVMVSDSCHSGTIARDGVYSNLVSIRPLMIKYGGTAQPRFRVTHEEIAAATYNKHRAVYSKIVLSPSAYSGDQVTIGASVILIAACQDNQVAADGPEHGLFTQALLKTWGRGKYTESYYAFCRDIGKGMPPTQTPKLYTVGTTDPQFEREKPFSIRRMADSTTNTGGNDMSEWDSTASGDLGTVSDEWADDEAVAASSRPQVSFQIVMDQRLVARMSDKELYNFLKGEGSRAMMRAFVDARDASSTIDIPDDVTRAKAKWEFKLEATADVKSTDGKTTSGGGVKASVSVSF
jgi:metacaspase-1